MWQLIKPRAATMRAWQLGLLVPLFHPRHDVWNLHFRWNGAELNGITPTGRATVTGLAMNRPIALSIRREEMLRGRHPPPGHL